jgi:hypothetical protein
MQTAIHFSIPIIHKQYENLVHPERFGARTSDSTFVLVSDLLSPNVDSELV